MGEDGPFCAWTVIDKCTDGGPIIGSVVGVAASLNRSLLSSNKGDNSGWNWLIIVDTRARSFNIDVGTRVHLWLRAKVGIVDQGMYSRLMGAGKEGCSPLISILGKAAGCCMINEGNKGRHIRRGPISDMSRLIGGKEFKGTEVGARERSWKMGVGRIQVG